MQDTQETWVPFPGLEDPLEKEIATHASILACKIPPREELSGYSPWGRKGSHKTEHHQPPSLNLEFKLKA